MRRLTHSRHIGSKAGPCRQEGSEALRQSDRRRLVRLGEVPQVLELLGHLVLECDDIAAVLDHRAYCVFLHPVDFIDLLPVSAKHENILVSRHWHSTSREGGGKR